MAFFALFIPFYECVKLHPWFSTGCLVGSQANRLLSPQLKTWRTPLLSPTPTPPWTMWPRCWSPLTEGWEAWTARPAAPCLEAECTDRGWERWAASRWAKTTKRNNDGDNKSVSLLYKCGAQRDYWLWFSMVTIHSLFILMLLDFQVFSMKSLT